MPEDLSAPLLLKLQARFFLILPDIRYIRQQGYPELFANIDMNLYRKIFPLPFSANFKQDSFNFYRISGNEIIRKLFARIDMNLYRERYFRSPSPQTSSKILLNSTGKPATRLSGNFLRGLIWIFTGKDISAPLLLKLQARFFKILPDIRYIR